MSDLDTLIHDLAVARDEQRKASDAMNDLLAAAKCQPEFMLADDADTRARAAVEELSQKIRYAATAQFTQDKNKHPHEAVTIKIFTTVELGDKNDLREWCFANFRPALKLDEKAVTEAAKAGNVIPPGFATVTTEAKATIATDLEKYL